jgi:hypothetical protein
LVSKYYSNQKNNELNAGFEQLLKKASAFINTNYHTKWRKTRSFNNYNGYLSTVSELQYKRQTSKVEKVLSVFEASLLINKMKTRNREIMTCKYKHNKTFDAVRVEFICLVIVSNVLDYREEEKIENIFDKKITWNCSIPNQILNIQIKNKFLSDVSKNEIQNFKIIKSIIKNHTDIYNQMTKMGHMTKFIKETLGHMFRVYRKLKISKFKLMKYYPLEYIKIKYKNEKIQSPLYNRIRLEIITWKQISFKKDYYNEPIS